MVITSNSEQTTQEFAASIAQQYQLTGGIIALIGNLGSGKTTFTQGFAQALGITDRIISPTYTLIRQHPIPHSNRVLYHIDLYRLENINPTELGLTDIFNQTNNIVLIEWAERLADKLPKNSTIIHFQHLTPTTRQITMTSSST